MTEVGSGGAVSVERATGMCSPLALLPYRSDIRDFQPLFVVLAKD